jgi:hypothetical protein
VDSEFDGGMTPPLIADDIMQWDDPPELISIVEETDGMKVDEPIPLSEPVEVPIPHKSPLKEPLPASTDPPQRVINHEQTSRGASSQSQTYEEVTKRKAGSAWTPSQQELDDYYGVKGSPPLGRYRGDLDNGTTDEDIWYPFASKREFDLTNWFVSHRITKGAIDDYFQFVDMGWRGLEIKNANEMFAKVERIPYGIPEDGWTSHTIPAPEPHDRFAPTYTLYYRDVKQVIRFLLGHGPFQQDLSYAPVRLFNGLKQRVYNEMHTADWWWDTQDTLPDDATIVPLLLASDKTVLTQHRGDKSAWPIYLTIGNLSNRVRRTPSKTALILLGFIPVTHNKEERYLRGDLYHQALSVMLERECTA